MFVVTINVTTREISDSNPGDVRKVNVVESKGEGRTPEMAFHQAYDNSGLKEFIEAIQGVPKIISPGFGTQGS